MVAYRPIGVNAEKSDTIRQNPTPEFEPGRNSAPASRPPSPGCVSPGFAEGDC
jgi:hypothetical protein